MSDPQPNPSPTGGTTLIEILNELRRDGFAGQLIAGDDGRVTCTACSNLCPADDLAIHGYRRVEGSSDPADLNLVTWARCPSCDVGGVLVLGYGPNATPADEAVLGGLRLDDVETPGTTLST